MEHTNNFELKKYYFKEEIVSRWFCEIYGDGEVCDDSISESDGDNADDGAGA